MVKNHVCCPGHWDSHPQCLGAQNAPACLHAVGTRASQFPFAALTHIPGALGYLQFTQAWFSTFAFLRRLTGATTHLSMPSRWAPPLQWVCSPAPCSGSCICGVVLQRIGPQVLTDDLGRNTGQRGTEPVCQSAFHTRVASAITFSDHGQSSITSAILPDPGRLCSDNQLKKLTLLVS